MGWTNRQAVLLFRTSCEVLDVSAFLSHPIAPHLAAFYLAIARHRSVGGQRLASPAQFFAKLRSDKNQAKRSDSSFRADSLHPLCRLFGGPHVRHVRQMDRSQDAGAASAVPVVC
jgi:hypothetical protein